LSDGTSYGSPHVPRHISLFGGKYQGDFEEPKECDAFAKGVEAVLNHMAETSEEKSESNEAA
jgi:hypothetical protein